MFGLFEIRMQHVILFLKTACALKKVVMSNAFAPFFIFFTLDDALSVNFLPL